MAYSGVDLALADVIYRLGGSQWAWRDNYVTSVVIHHWGKTLSLSLAVAVIAGIAASYVSDTVRPWRRSLLYLFLAAGLSTALVSLLKRLTSADCPWDLIRYGGEFSYVPLWRQLPDDSHRAACFPAGHASAGYAWIALYYFFANAPVMSWRRWRIPALMAALGIGLVFGVSQQLRGAHFLSHDLWTLMICWTVTSLLARYMFPGSAFGEEREGQFQAAAGFTAMDNL